LSRGKLVITRSTVRLDAPARFRRTAETQLQAALALEPDNASFRVMLAGSISCLDCDGGQKVKRRARWLPI